MVDYYSHYFSWMLRKIHMPSKIRKSKKFSIVAAVKSNARDRIGTPKASFVIEPKSKKATRFKKTLVELLDTEKEN
jgi:hypothetical protein